MAAVEYNLREEESSMLEILTMNTWVWWGGEGKKGSHTTQDLQTYASRLFDRQMFEWGRWTLEEKTEENTRQWRMKNRFPEGRGILRTWSAAHTRTEAMETERGNKPSDAVTPEPGQEPADLGWEDGPLLSLNHLLLSSNVICTVLG